VIPFERPRARTAVLEHADYYDYRGQLITFLEDQAHHRDMANATPGKAAAAAEPADDAPTDVLPDDEAVEPIVMPVVHEQVA
jgi:hypothetical protein